MSVRREDQDRRSGAAKKRDAARGVQFACHVEVGVGESPDADCVLDYGDVGGCMYAKCRREKWTCHYWAPLAGQPADPVAAARAEGFRAGAEAMRDAAAEMAGGFLMTKTALPVEKIVDCEERIRSLDISEEPHG